MKTRADVLRSHGYWSAKIQLDLFREFKIHLEKHPKSADKIPKWYLARIMNGNFNGSISKLVELSLLIGLVPQIKYTSVTKIIELDKK